MEVKIEPSWREVLQGEFDSPYFAELVRFVRAAYARGTVYPPGRLIFEAFNRTPLDKVRVVVLGQDPYHEPGHLREKQASITLSVYDILGQRKNISRNVTGDYIEDVFYNSLGRYGMVTFTYRFNTFKKGEQPKDRNADRWGGGPGRFGPGGRPGGGRPPF